MLGNVSHLTLKRYNCIPRAEPTVFKTKVIAHLCQSICTIYPLRSEKKEPIIDKGIVTVRATIKDVPQVTVDLQFSSEYHGNFRYCVLGPKTTPDCFTLEKRKMMHIQLRRKNKNISFHGLLDEMLFTVVAFRRLKCSRLSGL